MKLFVNETNNLRKNCRGAYKEASTSIYDKKRPPRRRSLYYFILLPSQT